MAWGLEYMSSAEFAEWQAYFSLEPLGEVRADLRNAIACKVLADVNTPSGKKRSKIEDFMPNFEPKEKQSPEAMMQQAVFANMAFDGLDLRERDDD